MMRAMTRSVVVALSLLVVTSCGTTDREACRGREDPPDAPVLAIHHVPSLTRERYESVVRGLTNGRTRLESLSDGGIEGLRVHVAGEGTDGFWIVDVWESRDAVDRFAQRVRPIAQEAGVEEPLKTYSVHTFLAC